MRGEGAALISASPGSDKPAAPLAAGGGIMIEVKRLPGDDPLTFDVLVREGDGETRHRVTLAADDLARLAPARAPEHCIEAAFLFLLDREPPEAILRRFDLAIIARYFPEFERELPRWLADIGAGRAP